MKTILITGIGGDIAQGVATIVRETFPGWRVVGADIHHRHGGALFVDQVFRAPVATDPLYDQWLAELLAREGVDLCIPMSEAELIHLAEHRGPEFGNVMLIGANRRAVEIGSDKLRTSEFLASIGVARPWTVPVEDFGPSIPFPCIFKVRRGAGSKAVFVCETALDVEFYRNRHPPSVLQELLLPADQEVTCAVFRSRDGNTVSVQLLRTLVGGFTGWAQVISDPEVAAQCMLVADALNLRGSINVQLRLTSSGPRIFEINPRFSSTVLIRHRMGFRDVVWSLQEALGEEVSFHQPTTGTVGVRIQGAALCSR